MAAGIEPGTAARGGEALARWLSWASAWTPGVLPVFAASGPRADGGDEPPAWLCYRCDAATTMAQES